MHASAKRLIVSNHDCFPLPVAPTSQRGEINYASAPPLHDHALLFFPCIIIFMIKLNEFEHYTFMLF